MSDNYTESPEDDGDGDDFKNLRAKAKKADQFERENQTLKRELAFVKAGVPLEDPKMSYFVKGYDGDLEPEKIRDAAISAGFMQAPEPVVDAAVDQAREGQQRVAAATAGATHANDDSGVRYGAEQAYREGGLEALSAYTAQYGVTFNPEPIS
jgi:hypothetical protein